MEKDTKRKKMAGVKEGILPRKLRDGSCIVVEAAKAAEERRRNNAEGGWAGGRRRAKEGKAAHERLE